MSRKRLLLVAVAAFLAGMFVATWRMLTEIPIDEYHARRMEIRQMLDDLGGGGGDE